MGPGSRRDRDAGSDSAGSRSVRCSTRRPGCDGTPIACLRVSFADPRPNATAASRTTASPRSTIATRSSRAASPCRRSAATRRHGPHATSPTRASTTRHEIVDVAPVGDRRRCSPRTTCTSCRWAGPRRDDPGAVREPPPRPGCRRTARVARRMSRCPTLPSRVERVLNLLALLLDTRRALTREDIVHEVAGYPPQSRRIPARVRARQGNAARHGRADHDRADRRRRRARLPRPARRLLPARSRPRRRGARRAARRGERGLARQPARRGRADEARRPRLDEAATPIASLPIAPALATLFEAFRARAVVTFTHRGNAYAPLEPWGLSSKRGHWYVVGFDRDRERDPRVPRRPHRRRRRASAQPTRSTPPPDFRPDDHVETGPGCSATTTR